MKIVILGTAILGAGLLLPGVAEANHQRSARIEGFDAFRKSEMSGIALTDDGVIRPGPNAAELAPDAGAQVWSVIRGRDGALYAASGSDGSVYRIVGDTTERFGQTFEYEVFAQVEGKDGRLFVAGAPNGTITEIRRDGSANTIFDTPEKIVWSLLADQQGNLYAGTGDRGLLYKVTPDGRGTVLYRAQDSHIVTLAWSNSGKLIAGTDGRGLLLEIDPQSGSGRVLYEVESSEISKVLVAPSGAIYFAAANTAPPKEGKPEGKGDQDPTGMAISGSPDQDSGQGPSSAGPRVLLREPDGTVRVFWQAPEGAIHALALDVTGRLLVGTGDRAALYRIESNGDATLLWKPDVGQVLCLLAEKNGVIAGTGNPGKVFRLGPENDEDSWIRPEPVGAGASASWGRLIWDTKPGAGRWEMWTRSGQTQEPDSTWSPWSAPIVDPDGGQIASPPARYIQIEGHYIAQGKGDPLTGLSRLWLSYSEPNMPPHVSKIRFSRNDGGGGGASRDADGYAQDLGGGIRVQIQRNPAPSEPDQGRLLPSWVRDVKSVVWVADDPDSDSMTFRLGLRQVGESAFHPLADDLAVNGYAIDANKLPDGLYEVEVTASDSPSNPPGQALEDRKIGGPFRIDHTPPDVVELRASRTEARRIDVEGTARDNASPIVRLEISWDGKPWKPIVPESGFLDAREEPFKAVIPLDREDEGSWIAVRAVDASGNEGIGRVWLRH